MEGRFRPLHPDGPGLPDHSLLLGTLVLSIGTSVLVLSLSGPSVFAWAGAGVLGGLVLFLRFARRTPTILTPRWYELTRNAGVFHLHMHSHRPDEVEGTRLHPLTLDPRALRFEVDPEGRYLNLVVEARKHTLRRLVFGRSADIHIRLHHYAPQQLAQRLEAERVIQSVPAQRR